MNFMKLSSNELKHLSNLCSLEVNDEEKLLEDVSNIITMANQLAKIDTSTTSALSHPLEIIQRLREDTVTEKDCSEQLFKNAPESEGHVFLVPKVIDNE
jgi:aspartyl-tRNA(Asn)/glutamyl-tRNA(Gln) amidotransferase subunit C